MSSVAIKRHCPTCNAERVFFALAGVDRCAVCKREPEAAPPEEGLDRRQLLFAAAATPALTVPDLPASHNSDPSSSYQAEAEAKAPGGSAEAHRHRIYQWLVDPTSGRNGWRDRIALERADAYTSQEIADGTGLELYQVRRRLPEMREGGWIENGSQRRCMSPHARLGQKLVLTWRVRRRVT